jgi:hypothetical protein
VPGRERALSSIEHLTKDFGRSLLVSAEVFHALETDDNLSGLAPPGFMEVQLHTPRI